MFGMNPVDAQEILDLLNLKSYEYNEPKTYDKVRQVLEYFKDVPDRRFRALKALQGKFGDKLDILWEYVSLKKEQEQKLSKLKPEQFETDIAKELSEKHLTIKTRERIREDIKRRREAKERKKQEQQEQKQKDKTEKLIDEIDLDEVEQTLNEVDTITDALKHYE